MLLIIEALFLISAALLQDRGAAVEGQIYTLDMALNSVDDQYDGCTKDMTKRVETEYLKKELRNANFKSAWKKGEDYIKKVKDNLSINHLIAIYVYTDDLVFRKFSNDTRNGKQNYTGETYKWHSLHFLLTNAIQILKKTQNACFNTYRATNHTFNVNKTVRFGSFGSSSSNRNKTSFYGTKTCFEIQTCKGAYVANYSKLPHEEEVLIPPYEMFEVTQVRNRTDQKDLWCETVYTLKSSGNKSALNCALFKKSGKSLKKHYILD